MVGSESARRPLSSDAKVNDLYERKTPEEHVLLRPGMYVGSVDKITEELFVYDKKSRRMQLEEVSYSPGLVKLFDEILVNAADNLDRSAGKMNAIDISLDRSTQRITVRNNGAGIPVVMHEKEKVYIPELVLGNLLTGSNFDDTVERFTGGRHGYGAKLTNILSNSFRVETLDAERNLLFEMEWHDHMKPVGEGAKVTELSAKEVEARGGGYTEISFVPDLKVFKMARMDKGTLQVIDRRVRDIAGLLAPSIQVTWNGVQIKVASFEEFASQFYVGATKTHARQNGALFEKGKWRVVVLQSPLDNDPLMQSFVNRMATPRGGQHVDHILKQLEPALLEAATKKLPKSNETKITRKMVQQKLALFVDCRLPNPSFDTQVKDKLTSKVTAQNGCELPASFLTSVVKKTGIVESIVAEAQARDNAVLTRAPRRTSRKSLLSIPKLEDANWAGTSRSSEATLILTEGDSAKALAVAGLPVVGRDGYGVFPLRGKPLNVRDATARTVVKNEEIKNLCTILGLDFKKKYASQKEKATLRYGRVMLMTDQDFDGSHIKGLLINLFHFFWPELLKTPGFLCEFVTPLIKVSSNSKGKSAASGGKLSFFTMQDYENWLASSGIAPRAHSVKYYKGLGTSTSSEAREYFGNLPKHVLDFKSNSPTEASELIDMAFNKKRASDRRDWISLALQQQADGKFSYVDHSANSLRFEEFINQELVLFSQHDLERSVPSALDGLKPSQRKVLFAALKRNLTSSELKVAQLAGYVGEQTAYHHGEQSLYATIINMAQDFVGSNNLPLLFPSGQFGTRLQGGKDAASPRYIFTRLQEYTRAIFPPEDDALLERNEDDGMVVEPVVYKPIIPMALINGAEGIGTGWSTFVPAHNPLEVIANVRRLLQGEPLVPMMPWYEGFKGTIEPRTWISKKKGTFTYEDGFVSSGVIERLSKTEAVVSELPIGRWTEDFKLALRNLVTEDKLADFSEHHDESSVRFTLKGTGATLDKLCADSAALRMSTKLLTSNMHFFDLQGRVKRYTTPEEIIEAFYPARLGLYAKRRQVMLDDMRYRVNRLQNQARFALAVSEGSFAILGKSKADILDQLVAEGFDREDSLGKTGDDADDEGGEAAAEAEAEADDDAAGHGKRGRSRGPFDYLVNTPLWDLTQENVLRIRKELSTLEDEFKTLQQLRPEDLWLRDLDRLEKIIVSSK
ncbi:DNA topoisomerase 2 [Hondaea fermentalgiana]|uniref:DNA topoisomerase 2 n=1 Tax=Hondaea fermentalgiana TaxID=2315210 RepID=A0A2R5FZY3_9STRA|nr:DNA topoisomerase 2 [Hondaea fermentalgiana]|eukprot:GBG24322.1 DNA topoisomerase 2 [Hondaea fermentalgiana]